MSQPAKQKQLQLTQLPNTRATSLAKQQAAAGATTPGPDLACNESSDSGVCSDPVTKKDIESLLNAHREILKEDMSKLIDSSTESLRQSVHSLGERFAAFDIRLRDTEEIAGDNFQKLNDLEAVVKTLRVQTTTLQDRVDELENRSRRSNLRIINVPVGSERGRDPVEFAAEMIMSVTGSALFDKPPEIERAHRAPGPRHSGAQDPPKPRAFIIKFLRFQDKEKMLKWARRHPVDYHGVELRVYADIGTALARKRAAFNAIKNALYQKGIKFRLLYPARLSVSVGDETHYFDSVDSAQEFYDQRFSNA